MIHLFSEGRKIIFFPIKWANSVSNWLLGVNSKSSTIRITNDLTPTENGSCSFDVEIEEVYRQMHDRLVNEFVSKKDLAREIDNISDLSISTDGDILQTTDKNSSDSSGSGSATFSVRVGLGGLTDYGFYSIINWIAFGSEADLNTYTGESIVEGLTIPAFTSSNVKIILGPCLQGMYSCQPIRESASSDNITGIRFGYYAQLLNNPNECESVTLSNNNASGNHCVKPIISNGTLTALHFGTDSQLTENNPSFTVDVASGCPYGN